MSYWYPSIALNACRQKWFSRTGEAPAGLKARPGLMTVRDGSVGSIAPVSSGGADRGAVGVGIAGVDSASLGVAPPAVNTAGPNDWTRQAPPPSSQMPSLSSIGSEETSATPNPVIIDHVDDDLLERVLDFREVFLK